MIRKVGLLPASNGSQINFAYNFYKDESDNGKYLAKEFKKTFCTDVEVYFLGLFDCVASVGFFLRRPRFGKTATNTVRYLRHAMALDERRAKFKVCHWQQEQSYSTLEMMRRGAIDLTSVGGMHRRFSLDPRFKFPKALSGIDSNQAEEAGKYDQTDSSADDISEIKFKAHEKANGRYPEFVTDALEVWFMGAHPDIGGGAVRNESRHMLSRIPLRWMIRQCFECDTGILFDMARLAEHGLDVATLWPEYRAQRLDGWATAATDGKISREDPSTHSEALNVSAYRA